MNAILRRLNRPVTRDGALFHGARATGGLLAAIGLFPPNRRFDFVRAGDAVLILTPLSGSSTLRLGNHGRVTHHLEPVKEVLMLWRDDADRMQSAFNKKLRNPASLFKAAGLAHLGGLGPDASAEAFVAMLERLAGNPRKDKHLFLNGEILQRFGLRPESVVCVDIAAQAEAVAQRFGLKMTATRNATAEKAVWQEPVQFSPDLRARINAIGAAAMEAAAR